MKYILLILSVLLISVCTSVTVNEPVIEKSSGKTVYNYQLQEGKNYIVINFTTSRFIFVKELVNNNPDIEVVSYKYGEKTIGYVNAMGGVGKNFVLIPGNVYEVILKEDSKIMIEK